MNSQDPTDTADSPTAQDPRPSMAARICYAIPLFLLFLIIAILLRVSGNIEEMFKEMSLGGLPSLTIMILSFASALKTYPWIFSGSMFLLAWIQFAWVARTQKRLKICFAWVMTCFGFIGILIPLSLFLPFIQITNHCLVTGTTVLTDRGPEPIEKLQVGRKVLTCGENGHTELGKITACYHFKAESYLRIIFTNGITLCATPEHPILTTEGYKLAGELTSKDFIKASKGYTNMATVTEIQEHVSVHDLTVEPNHNYLANGIWVHNKIGNH